MSHPLYQIYQSYLSLSSTLDFNPQYGLGGKLLYAAEIDVPGRELLFAANIAGAASIAASPDPSVQRQAIRDGAINFLVTSLEEALRILKNEIRKHQPVSVGVTISAAQLTDQMLERGVLPDMIPSASTDLFSVQESQFAKFLQQGAKQLQPAPANPHSKEFITWSVDRQPVRWLSRIDALVQSIVPVEDTLRQRWLRLAPRYLGRLAQSDHGIALTEPEIAQLKSQCQTLIESANIPGQALLQITIQTR